MPVELLLSHPSPPLIISCGVGWVEVQEVVEQSQHEILLKRERDSKWFNGREWLRASQTLFKTTNRLASRRLSLWLFFFLLTD